MKALWTSCKQRWCCFHHTFKASGDIMFKSWPYDTEIKDCFHKYMIKEKDYFVDATQAQAGVDLGFYERGGCKFA